MAPPGVLRERLDYFVKLAAIVSGLAALITLATALVQIRRDYHKSQIKEWQDTTIYSIISQAPLQGLTIPELKQKYKDMANDLPKELPREEIQTPALMHSLLELISIQAVSRRNDGRFGVVVGPYPMSPETVDSRMRTQPAFEYILQLLSASPASYFTHETLSERVHRKVPNLTDEEFDQIFGQMRAQGSLYVGSDGKVSLGNPHH